MADISAYIKLQVPAGAANPAPPIGPALGQHGLNIQDFCTRFNSATGHLERGMPVPVVISVFTDRKFDFVVKSPPASVLLRKAAGIDKGSSTPNTDKVGKVTRQQIEEIIEIKKEDLNAANPEAAFNTIAGTARSMGIEVSADA